MGDVEILLNTGSTIILEAWDAKYGKEDLREEVEELSEKLQNHPDCALAGFVANQQLKISEKLRSRIQEIEDIIARANVIDVTKINNDGKVIFCSTVFLQNLDNNENINYKIVGKDEADLKKNLLF